MNDSKLDVRIFLTIGLIVLSVLHAVTLTTAQRVAPHVERALFDSPSTMAPIAPRGGINFDESRNSGGIVNTLPVNNAARDEIKRQTGSQPYCPPCDVNPPQATPVAPAKPSGMIAKPTTPRYSIEVFVLHNDPLSATVLNWFNTNATLQTWKKSTNHNTYTRDSGLYKTRYANQIPVSSFPVVLVTAPDGGHVYVSDRDTTPGGASELVKAISDAMKIQKQAKEQAQQPKPPPNQDSCFADGRQSLIDAIVTDCPDGNCEPMPREDREPFWRRWRDQSDSQGIEMLGLRLFRPLESMLTLSLVVVLVFGVVYVLRRLM